MAMMESGMTQAEAREKIWMFDKHGLIVKVGVCVTKTLMTRTYIICLCGFLSGSLLMYYIIGEQWFYYILSQYTVGNNVLCVTPGQTAGNRH